MKFWLIFCLICVLQIPVDKFQRMPEGDREALRLLTINEFCRMYAEKYGVEKFNIREEIKDGIWKLHINPINTEI